MNSKRQGKGNIVKMDNDMDSGDEHITTEFLASELMDLYEYTRKLANVVQGIELMVGELVARKCTHGEFQRMRESIKDSRKARVVVVKPKGFDYKVYPARSDHSQGPRF